MGKLNLSKLITKSKEVGLIWPILALIRIILETSSK